MINWLKTGVILLGMIATVLVIWTISAILGFLIAVGTYILVAVAAVAVIRDSISTIKVDHKPTDQY